MLTAGTLRVCWSVALAFVRPGIAGLVLVIVVELCLITCMGLLASITSLRAAIAIAGILLLATPLLLPSRRKLQDITRCSAPAPASAR